MLSTIKDKIESIRRRREGCLGQIVALNNSWPKSSLLSIFLTISYFFKFRFFRSLILTDHKRQTFVTRPTQFAVGCLVNCWIDGDFQWQTLKENNCGDDGHDYANDHSHNSIDNDHCVIKFSICFSFVAKKIESKPVKR